MDPHSSRIFSFCGFLFDPESGELTQNGARVRLGKQSADILAIILLNAGSLVTRQRLRELLWPGGEIVIHEKIINNAIGRLRYIFQDDPLAPTFIERVPKRGYRWIMPVEQIERVNPSLHKAAAVVTLEPEQKDKSQVLEINESTIPSPAEAAPHESVTHDPLSSRRWGRLSFAFAGLILLAIGIGFLFWRSRQVAISKALPPPQTISLAVAPLDASGPGATELAQSFRLDLTDALAQLPQVQVRSTHSINQLKLTDALLPEYSTKLGLDVVLFGTLKRSLRRCDLQFELVRVRDSVHLATFRYSGPIDQLGKIRDSIQRDIFAKLRLSGNGDRPLTGSTSDPEAYQSYLQARYQFSLQSDDSLSLAVKEYNLAIDRDRGFTQAYIGLAQTYLIAALHNILMPPREALIKAGDAVKHAQALDESSGEVHSILGFIRFYRDWDLVGGIDEERQAIRIEPHQPIYHQWLALMLSAEGKYQEALSEITLAEADDPYWPSLYVTEAYISSHSLDMHRMLSAAHKLNELLPDSSIACNTMANALWYSGHQIEGIAEWRRLAVRDHDPERIAMEDRGLAAYRRDGVQGYARVRIAELANSRETKLYPNDFDPEEWYMAAGESKRAIDALRQEANSHDPSFLEEAMGNIYISVRNDPEFIALLKQNGLASQLSATAH